MNYTTKDAGGIGILTPREILLVNMSKTLTQISGKLHSMELLQEQEDEEGLVDENLKEEAEIEAKEEADKKESN